MNQVHFVKFFPFEENEQSKNKDLKFIHIVARI